MNGADYIATRTLYDNQKGMAVVAEAGDTCEDVNPDSLPWLVDQGWIVAKPQGDVEEED